MNEISQSVLLVAVIFIAVQSFECARFLQKIYARQLHKDNDPSKREW